MPKGVSCRSINAFTSVLLDKSSAHGATARQAPRGRRDLALGLNPKHRATIAPLPKFTRSIALDGTLFASHTKKSAWPDVLLYSQQPT